ncbi:MAG TPA: ABC transporter permease [Gemmatimonadales bacterium]|nr:ABC transporter permease [Gemmatimonadales bacterium]
MLRRLIRSLRNLVRRQSLDRDLDEEIASYEDLLTAERHAGGLRPDAARRAARLDLGGADAVKEAVRDVRAGALAESLGRDLRYAFRTLSRSPGFTLFTLLTFAVALGGLTVIFSFVNALLLKPLPYPDSNRLVVVLETDDDDLTGGYTLAAPNYLDWQQENRVFSAMAMYQYLGANLSDGPEPEQVGGIRVTGGVFELLGVPPLLGRGLLPSDDGPGTRVVVLSHRLWQRRYGSDSSLVGKTILINGEASQVVGVMPDGFAFPSANQQIWLPINLNADDQNRGSHSFMSIARLKDGVSIATARSELRAIGHRLAAAYPATNTNETVNVFAMRDLWIEGAENVLRTLLAAVVLVLLIAAANIASLLVARGAARRREIATRMGLGGSRTRIARQLVTESVVLALGGAALGLGLATLGTRALFAVFPQSLRSVPFRDLTTVSLDGTVVLVGVLVALLTGIAAGLAPALTSLPAEPAELLRDAGARSTTARHTHRLKSVLVGGEVALAMLVLVGAGLLIASISRLQRVAPGLDPANVIAVDLALPQADFYGPAERVNLCADLSRETALVPGVVATSAVSHVPLSGANAGRSFVLEGALDPGPANLPSASYGVACPGFFQTLGIPLRTGRDFTSADRPSAPMVMVINEALGEKYFPGVNPVGRRIKLGRFETDGPWVTIIGVIGNVRHGGLAQPVKPYFYAPYAQAAWPGMTVMIRTSAPLDGFAPLRQALRRAAPREPIGDPFTMEQVVENSLGHLRFPMVLFSVFAAMALLLAALGCFGIASQAVVQRRRELGIRIALGARTGQIYRLVAGQALVPILAGLGAGALGALAFAQVLRSLLFDIGPGDPITLLLGSAVLGVVTVLASLLPARRAAQVDPARVLRDE